MSPPETLLEFRLEIRGEDEAYLCHGKDSKSKI